MNVSNIIELEQFIISICSTLGYDLNKVDIDSILYLSNNRDIRNKILECFNEDSKCIDINDFVIENINVQKIVKCCLKKYGYTIVDFSAIEVNENDFSNFNEASADLSMYQLLLNDISSKPLLTPIEEKNLFLKYEESHDISIRDVIIESNLRLVISIAKGFLESGIDFLDLIQSGNEGLIKAFDRFDVHKGYKFSTYATWWIRQTIILSIKNDSRTIRLPVATHGILNKMSRVEEKLWNKLFRKPTVQELAEEMNVSVDRINYFRQIRLETLSLDQPCEKRGSDECNTLIDMVSNEVDVSNNVINNNLIIDALNTPTLTEQEKDVIIKYYFYDMSMEKISEDYNTSRQRIFQIKGKALEKMKKYNHLSLN